jgi:hypothetical protein
MFQMIILKGALSGVGPFRVSLPLYVPNDLPQHIEGKEELERDRNRNTDDYLEALGSPIGRTFLP